ncbi:MAG: chromate resistance protein [Thiovulaceae bacterium]|nr:chromate resistance protein [Sulfurimonadaceae bacterium]
MRIWRRLQNEGVLSLNGSYILPYDDERFELCQWLRKEIESLNGTMNFFITQQFEPLSNDDLIEMFNQQAELSYTDVEDKIKQLQQLIEIKQDNDLEAMALFKKIKKEFDELWKIDFFKAQKGIINQQELFKIELSIESYTRSISQESIPLCNIHDYQNKQWLTRPKPFIDRMASAWLIRNFIDQQANFIFTNNSDDTSNIVSYDMDDANFTHVGNLCTFEVMLLSFGIKDSALASIAKIIHNLDLKDNRYMTPEAYGVEIILSGIRHKYSFDIEILEHSMIVFDGLYQNIKSGK